MKVLEHTISDTFLSALINLDYSGLEKEEIGQLNNWLADHSFSFVNPVSCEPVGFTLCEITELRGNCHKVYFLSLIHS